MYSFFTILYQHYCGWQDLLHPHLDPIKLGYSLGKQVSCECLVNLGLQFELFMNKTMLIISKKKKRYDPFIHGSIIYAIMYSYVYIYM